MCAQFLWRECPHYPWGNGPWLLWLCLSGFVCLSVAVCLWVCKVWVSCFVRRNSGQSWVVGPCPLELCPSVFVSACPRLGCCARNSCGASPFTILAGWPLAALAVSVCLWVCVVLVGVPFVGEGLWAILGDRACVRVLCLYVCVCVWLFACLGVLLFLFLSLCIICGRDGEGPAFACLPGLGGVVGCALSSFVPLVAGVRRERANPLGVVPSPSWVGLAPACSYCVCLSLRLSASGCMLVLVRVVVWRAIPMARVCSLSLGGGPCLANSGCAILGDGACQLLLCLCVCVTVCLPALGSCSVSLSLHIKAQR